MRANLIAVLLVLLVAPLVGADGGEAEVLVEELLRDLGEREQKVIVIDEALRGKRVRFLGGAPATPDLDTVKAVLGTEPRAGDPPDSVARPRDPRNETPESH